MKKKLPYALTKAYEEVLSGHMHKFKFLSLPLDPAVHLIEDNSGSNFSFSYFGDVHESGKTKHKYSILPFTIDRSGPVELEINTADVKAYLEGWVRRVEKFNEPSPVFDLDPVLQGYINEQAPFFEILDEDADTARFELPQQIVVHNSYTKIIQELTNENKNDPEVKGFVSELRADQKAITVESKSKVISNYSKNIAKARKFGLDVFAKILVKISADGIVDLLPKIGGFLASADALKKLIG